MRPGMCNEREVRAAAGLTMAIGAVAFSYAYFTKHYVPLQVAASVFFVEFLVRVTAGIRYSPIGLIARAMTLGQPPEWVSIKPKRFAWSLGLAMALSMTVITNVGIRGYLPRTICLICLTLMWMESALGLCLGCKIYGLLLRRGWIGADPEIEVCADGACEPRPKRSSARFGLTAMILVIGALLITAAPAVAAKKLDTRPVRSYSVVKMNQIGDVNVAGGSQRGGRLHKTVDMGPAAFILQPILAPARAIADVLSTADGKDYHVLAQAPVKDPRDPFSGIGTATHLDEVQSYRKRSGDASVSINVSRVVLDALDNNGPLPDEECPEKPCDPMIAAVQFHARAYQPGTGQFFGMAGNATLQGSFDGWKSTVGAFNFGVMDTNQRLWVPGDFVQQGLGTSLQEESRVSVRLKAPREIEIPLFPVKKGNVFAVDVRLDAEAVNDRGGESAVEAFIEDPQHGDPPLIKARGLQALGKPKFKEPAVKPSPPARCPAGPARGAGAIGLSAPAYSVGEEGRNALVQVTRTGGSRGAASVNLSTTGGSAQSGSDFTSTSTRVRFGNRDAAPILVEIPIHQDGAAESPETFTVSLAGARCAKLAAPSSATVTIQDDDTRPVVHPAPAFTVGGTVDGLEGSGLVLTDLRRELPVGADGSFTFPDTRGSGEDYEVKVQTQPTNPDQVCTVEHGTGTVSIANVTDVVVRCTTSVPPAGLDTTFGNGGKVETPLGLTAEGEAVVVQPDGKIVTAGSAGTEIASDFGLTRHDDSGHLDPSFGNGGTVTTDLGGAGDHAFDAALDPNGGIIAVGRTDVRGPHKTDFALVDYLPDGTPNPSFGNNGIVITPIFGKGAQANAVAIQGDKILVAGFAIAANGIDSDFVLVRYNLDGSVDKSFGIVTTDLGTENDAALGMAIQPDGKIVLAGVAEDNIALARYQPDGALDLSFGSFGKVVGFEGVASGVAVTPGGTILVAGEKVGSGSTQDFMVASYGPNGTLNRGFGKLGVVTTDLSGAPDYAEDLLVDGSGGIVVVGRSTSPTSPPLTDMALVRYKSDGTVGDTLTVDFHGLGEFGQDVALDAKGRIVAVGSTANGSNTEFALIRASL